MKLLLSLGAIAFLCSAPLTARAGRRNRSDCDCARTGKSPRGPREVHRDGEQPDQTDHHDDAGASASYCVRKSVRRSGAALTHHRRQSAHRQSTAEWDWRNADATCSKLRTASKRCNTRATVSTRASDRHSRRRAECRCHASNSCIGSTARFSRTLAIFNPLQAMY